MSTTAMSPTDTVSENTQKLVQYLKLLPQGEELAKALRIRDDNAQLSFVDAGSAVYHCSYVQPMVEQYRQPFAEPHQTQSSSRYAGMETAQLGKLIANEDSGSDFAITITQIDSDLGNALQLERNKNWFGKNQLQTPSALVTATIDLANPELGAKLDELILQQQEINSRRPVLKPLAAKTDMAAGVTAAIGAATQHLGNVPHLDLSQKEAFLKEMAAQMGIEASIRVKGSKPKGRGRGRSAGFEQGPFDLEAE